MAIERRARPYRGTPSFGPSHDPRMITAPIKRALPYHGHVRLADGTRNPVQIVAQRMGYVWVQVSRPTRLPDGRISTTRRDRVHTSFARSIDRSLSESGWRFL